MKLMRWVEQHIRVGRKKDKDNQNSQRGSRGSKQKGPRSASVESGSILKLQVSMGVFCDNLFDSLLYGTNYCMLCTINLASHVTKV